MNTYSRFVKYLLQRKLSNYVYVVLVIGALLTVISSERTYAQSEAENVWQGPGELPPDETVPDPDLSDGITSNNTSQPLNNNATNSDLNATLIDTN